MSPRSRVPDALRDHGLAVPRRAIDEQRPACADGRSQLVQHAVAEHQRTECLANAAGRRIVDRGSPEVLEVAAVLFQRHRRNAHVVVVFEEQRGSLAARIGDPVLVGRPPIVAPATISTWCCHFSSSRLGSITANCSPRRVASSSPVSVPARCSVFSANCVIEIDIQARFLEGARRSWRGHVGRFNDAHGSPLVLCRVRCELARLSSARARPSPARAGAWLRGRMHPRQPSSGAEKGRRSRGCTVRPLRLRPLRRPPQRPRDRRRWPWRAPGCCGLEPDSASIASARRTRAPQRRRPPPAARNSRGCSAHTRRRRRVRVPARTARARRARGRGSAESCQACCVRRRPRDRPHTARYASPRPMPGKPQSRQMRASPSHAALARGSRRAALAKCSCAWSGMPSAHEVCAR